LLIFCLHKPLGCQEGEAQKRCTVILKNQPIECRIDIVSKHVRIIAADEKSHERIMYDKLNVSTGGSNHLFEPRWLESILYELDECDIVKGVRRGPAVGLFTDVLQRKLAG
jgi:hypothetical protein